MDYAGHAMSSLEFSGNISKMKLTVDGISVPIVPRKGISGCTGGGFTFILDPNTFGEVKCTPIDPYWGGTGKKRSFKLSIDGVTMHQYARERFVFSLPRPEVTAATGPASVSKLAGGNPTWTVTGRNMYYNKVRFLSTGCGPTVETQTTCGNSFCKDLSFSIPLILLNENCTYNIWLVSDCGATKNIGQIKINP